MSDSQFPAGSEVEEQAGTPSQAQDPASSPSTPPSIIEIDGKTYSREDILRLQNQTKEMQRDYTRKTQAIADERRAFEARIAAVEAAHRNNVSRETNDDPIALIENEHEPLGRALRLLEQKISSTQQHVEESARERQVRLEHERRESEVDSVLTGMEYESRPFFNRNEMKGFMLQNGLAPDQANLAYSALYGQRLGQKVGESEAMARGSAPAPMGASKTRISTPFTSPEEAPGIDYSNASWEDVKRNAMKDTRI